MFMSKHVNIYLTVHIITCSCHVKHVNNMFMSKHVNNMFMSKHVNIHLTAHIITCSCQNM